METITFKNSVLKNKLIKYLIIILVLFAAMAIFLSNFTISDLSYMILHTSTETKMLLSIILFITLMPLIVSLLPHKNLKSDSYKLSSFSQKRKLLESRRKKNYKNTLRMYKKNLPSV